MGGIDLDLQLSMLTWNMPCTGCRKLPYMVSAFLAFSDFRLVSLAEKASIFSYFQSVVPDAIYMLAICLKSTSATCDSAIFSHMHIVAEYVQPQNRSDCPV